jgi:hypothetical protein
MTTYQAPQAEPFRVSPSLVSRYFFLECERFLRFRAASPARGRVEGLPQADFDHSPLMRDVMESGLAWEEQVVTQFLAGRVSVADGTGVLSDRRFDLDATQVQLTTLGSGNYLYQATLRPPQRFYEAFNLDPALLRFADCHPDLIEVIALPGGRRRFRVIDIKRGESLQMAYRVQVLLYALILDATLAEYNITDAEVDLETGGVWLGGASETETFDMTTLLPYLRQFLSEQLPQLLDRPAEDAFWHVSYNCERCGYLDHCRAEMQRTNNVSRLTNLTVHGKQHLAELGVRTLPDLETLLARPDADELLERCASLAGDRHYLEGRLAAFRAGSPRSQGSATALPRGENVAVFLTLQREPLGRSTYLYGMLVQTKPENAGVFRSELQADLFDAGGKGVPYVLVAASPQDASDTRAAFVRTLHALLEDLHAFNAGKQWQDQLSVQVYTHTDRDRDQLTEGLLECLRDPDLAEAAMDLLLHFQCPELLLSDEHPEQPVPFPVIVLQNALTKMVALPVEVSYTLPETLAALDAQWQYPRKDYYHYPLGHGLRSEAIHAAWFLGKPEHVEGLRREASQYLRAQRSLLWGLRSAVGEQLFAWPPKFLLPSRTGIQEPLLSRLAFFMRYESLLQYLALREDRAEPQTVQARNGLAMTLRALHNGELEVLDGLAMDIEPSTFPGWLLSRANAAGRRAQLEFKDYGARDKLFMKSSPHVALVSVPQVVEENGAPRRVRINYSSKFDGQLPAPGDLFQLQPRFTDFNTDRVITFLRALDQAGGGLFCDLLRDPEGASGPLPLPADVETVAAASETRLGLTNSQLSAYRSMRRRRTLAVWGPPGTGKTHFLATSILALAEAHRRAGRPFRVLITAFTHAAIENLLRKVSELGASFDPGTPLPTIGKAKIWQGSTPTGASTIADDRLSQWLGANAVSVVGATVYSCLKAQARGPMPGFDLVVVDEASQVRVSEASIPISLVGPEGRLVLAGDHLQLPPIVQGAYPEAEPGTPLLHRSIFELVQAGVPEGSPVVAKLLENRRMNDVLTSFASRLLYGPDYVCFDESVAARRLRLHPDASPSGLAAACLDSDHPMTLVVLEGVQATKKSLVEAQLVTDLALSLREHLLDREGNRYETDRGFFRHGLFVVSPHRAQNRAIRQELASRRAWDYEPFVDTVDKMQGQEAEVVLVSYGVADPEYALLEAEFIYSVNRLNVAITRAQSKSVVFLPRPLLEALPRVINQPEAERGLAFMRNLVDVAEQNGEVLRFDVGAGVTALVIRAGRPV